MSKRDEYVRALTEGRSAQLYAVNPYSGQSLVLAKLWMRVYNTMLLTRVYETPTMQSTYRLAADGGGNRLASRCV